MTKTKTEIRKPKEARNPNGTPATAWIVLAGDAALRFSVIGFLSAIGHRSSDFPAS
jgi:hypothetical protein